MCAASGMERTAGEECARDFSCCFSNKSHASTRESVYDAVTRVNNFHGEVVPRAQRSPALFTWLYLCFFFFFNF